MDNWVRYCEEGNWHPASKIFPIMDEQALWELAEDINDKGLLSPVFLHEDKVLDGRNRLLACRIAKVAPNFETWKPNGLGPTAWVISQNLKRRHLNPGQAATCAVDALPLLKEEAKQRQVEGGKSAGRGRPKGRQKIGEPIKQRGNATEQAAKQFHTNRTYIEQAAKLKERFPDTFEKVKSGEVPINQAIKVLGVHFSSKFEEWRTPPEIIERTVKVLETIDLDPCSNDGKPHIPAKKHFTAETDGLTKVWAGTVYMNPPYGDVIKSWVEKLYGEYESGNVPEAIALVPARTDTEWFSRFNVFPVCFIRGRLKFSGHENSAPFPSAVIYLGKSPNRFVRVFKDIGAIRPPCYND